MSSSNVKIENIFSRFARLTADKIGRPYTFVVAIFIFLAWFVSGQYFNYSSSWQSTIGTAVGIVTFLMVMLLQHSQNHDTRAIQLKLDELIRAQARATNDLIEIEKLTEAEVESIRKEQQEMRGQTSHPRPPASKRNGD